MNKKAIRKTQRTLPSLLQKWYQQLHSICRQIPLGKKDFAAKKSVLSIFFTDSWTNLEQVKKDKHSPTDCEWCLKNPIYKNTLSKLHIKTNAYRRKVFLHDFDGKTSAVLQNVTNEIVSDLNSDLIQRKFHEPSSNINKI